MERRIARWLTALYPREWRLRYGEEFVNFLESERSTFSTVTDVVSSAAGEHIRGVLRRISIGHSAPLKNPNHGAPQLVMPGITISRRGGAMRVEQVNRISGTGLIVFSLLALMTILPAVLIRLLAANPPPLPQDEGTGAHIFQLSVMAFAFTLMVFFATADWRQPLRSARPLIIPGAAVVLAFSLLYYFEHYM